MHGVSPQVKAEWAIAWRLPVLGCLGYSVSVLHIYILGPFMAPLQEAFGWGRAEVSAGLTIANLIGACAAVVVGSLVDRLGARRIALTGVLLLGAAVAALSTATGSIANWIFLWVVISGCALLVQPTVWSSAIVGHFSASRGLALAIILSGGSLTATILPLLSTWLIELVGWRSAFLGIALIWTGVLFPLLALFFRVSPSPPPSIDAPAAPTQARRGFFLSQALRRSSFYKLTFAGGFFAFGVIGTVVHFVPILVDNGAAPITAASAAAFIGLFAIVGRLGSGLLLDRLPGHYVGGLAFFLPVPACLLLLFCGANPSAMFAAAILLGLTLGAEIDLICYLTTRHFGLRNFGVILGALFACIGFGTASGPFVAGWIYDMAGTYRYFIMLAGGLALVASLAMLSLGRGPRPENLP